MARVKDLWLTAYGSKTAKHPDRGGNKNAKRWLACWDKADGTEGTKAFLRKIDASNHATTMEVEARRGVPQADPQRGNVSVRKYGETVFMPTMLHLRPNSADTYGSHLRNHIYPALGKKKMPAVTRSEVQAFVAAIARKLAPSTVETVYAVLRALMQHAVDEDPPVIAVNPCRKIKLPKVRRRVVEPLSADEVLALLTAITARYRVAVALGAGLGLREGEAFGLVVAKLDFLRRKAHIISQAQRGELAAELKTDASTRTVPADDWVLTGVSAHIIGSAPALAVSSSRTGSAGSPSGTPSASAGATRWPTPARAARHPANRSLAGSATRRCAPTPRTASPRARGSTT